MSGVADLCFVPAFFVIVLDEDLLKITAKPTAVKLWHVSTLLVVLFLATTWGNRRHFCLLCVACVACWASLSCQFMVFQRQRLQGHLSDLVINSGALYAYCIRLLIFILQPIAYIMPPCHKKLLQQCFIILSITAMNFEPVFLQQCC